MDYLKQRRQLSQLRKLRELKSGTRKLSAYAKRKLERKESERKNVEREFYDDARSRHVPSWNILDNGTFMNPQYNLREYLEIFDHDPNAELKHSVMHKLRNEGLIKIEDEKYYRTQVPHTSFWYKITANREQLMNVLSQIYGRGMGRDLTSRLVNEYPTEFQGGARRRSRSRRSRRRSSNRRSRSRSRRRSSNPRRRRSSNRRSRRRSSRRSQSGGRKACRRGSIRRRSYTRKDGVYIKSGCVKDMGKRGKTPKAERVLPKLSPGRLSRYGYSTFKPTKTRHEALHDAIRAEGYNSIVRRLVAVSNYNKRTAPDAHAIMRSDIKWAQEQMKPKYSH